MSSSDNRLNPSIQPQIRLLFAQISNLLLSEPQNHKKLSGLLSQCCEYLVQSKSEEAAIQAFFIATTVLRLKDPSNGVLENIFSIIRQTATLSPQLSSDLPSVFPVIPFVLADKGANEHGLVIAGLDCAAEIGTVIGEPLFVGNCASAVAHMVAVAVQAAQFLALDAGHATRCLEILLFRVIGEKARLRAIFPGIVSKLLKVCIESSPKQNVLQQIFDITARLIGSTFAEDKWSLQSGEKMSVFIEKLSSKYGGTRFFATFCDSVLSSSYKSFQKNALDALVENCTLEAKEGPIGSMITARLGSIVESAADAMGTALYSADHSSVERQISSLSKTIDRAANCNAVGLNFAVSEIASRIISELATLYGANSKPSKKVLVLSSRLGEVSEKQLNLFGSFLDSSVEKQLRNLCNAIGRHSDLAVAVMLSLLEKSSAGIEKNIGLWFCDNVLLGSKENITLEMTENVLSMLESVDVSSDLGVCVAVDTISASCEYLGADFEQVLPDNISILVEAFSSGSEDVSLHAQHALVEVSSVLYGGSIENLILNNADYLLDYVNVKLVSGISMTPETVSVLVALIRLAGGSLIAQFDDVVNSCFVVLDSYHGYSVLSTGFFEVFREIIDVVKKEYVKEPQENEEDPYKPWGMTSFDEMISFVSRNKLEEYQQVALFHKADSDDEEEEEEEKQIDYFKHVSSVPLNIYRLIQKMVSYSIRLMNSSMGTKVQVLELLRRSIEVLATQSVELNPVLYEIWPLVERECLDLNIKYSTGALRIAVEMIKYGGTFLNSNFVHFVPKLLKSQPWARYEKKMKMVRNVRPSQGTALEKKFELQRVFSGLELEYAVALNDLLCRGLHISGDLLEISQLRKIVEVISEDVGMFWDVYL